MAKAREKRRARDMRDTEVATVVPFKKRKFLAERSPPPIVALNETQARYLGCLRSHQQIFVIGPAGTGKTWLAATYAADLYRTGAISRIILTRPNVPCGRSLGYFPGSMDDKFAPWTVPVTDAIRDRLGPAVYDVALKNGDIEVVPFEVMRGRSWREAFVLLDEAQNTTASEIRMFLTRIGEDCVTVVNGDVAQCDLPGDSGLRKAIDLINSQALPVPVIEFTADDVVRSGLCAMWVRAFEAGAAPPPA